MRGFLKNKTIIVDEGGEPATVTGNKLDVNATVDTSLLATETTLATRLSESDFDTKTGSLTETAPATDTASSGLNGRLQRIAQRITSLIALFPTSLGANGGLKVDVLSIPLWAGLTANAPTFYNCTATSGVVIVSNANRKGLILTNTGTKDIYLAVGTAAIVGSGIRLTANGGTWNMDEHDLTTGEIRGITVSATSNIAIQEFQ